MDGVECIVECWKKGSVLFPGKIANIAPLAFHSLPTKNYVFNNMANNWQQIVVVSFIGQGVKNHKNHKKYMITDQ